MLAVLALAACSGDSPTDILDPSSQTITGTVDVFGTNHHALSVSSTGAMTVTLTWSDGSVDLDLVLAESSCTDLYSGTCTVLASSMADSGTSEAVSRTVTSGQAYSVFVDNFSTVSAQSYTITITIS